MKTGLCAAACLLLCLLTGCGSDTASIEPNGFLAVSAGDCSGVDTIIGIRSMQAFTDDAAVHPIESLDNGTYFALKYPFQDGEQVYYTTTHAATGEECIITKTDTQPEWSTFPEQENRYYRKTSVWEPVLRQSGSIRYKIISGDQLYYLLVTKEGAEIRRFDLQTKEDEPLLSGVHPDAGFDADAQGTILYVTADSAVKLRSADGTEQELGQGTAACFYQEQKILLADASGVSIRDLTDGTEQKLCSVTGNAILLSPSRTCIALCSQDESKNLEYDTVTVVELASGRTHTIRTLPDTLHGAAWLDGYYPIS